MRKKRFLPGWLVVVLDIMGVLVVLAVFALFPLIIPQEGEALRTVAHAPTPSGGYELASWMASTTQATAVPLPSSTPQPTTSAVPGDFSQAFSQRFPDEQGNVRIEVSTGEREGERGPVVYYVADIWIRDISNLRTAFAEGRYGTGIHEELEKMAEDNDALLAITGDYFGARPEGVVIRNGQLYRDSSLEDVCVLYSDGVMETYTEEEFHLQEAEARGIWQAWSFGPQLLLEGRAVSEFETGIYRSNPRSVIGYYEPGHYCFIVVDGRQDDYSKGMNLAELSQLAYDLGCKTAYNLDGGQTSAMTYMGELVNQPYNGGREISDIIYIGE